MIETIRFRNDTQTRKRLMVPEGSPRLGLESHERDGSIGAWLRLCGLFLLFSFKSYLDGGIWILQRPIVKTLGEGTGSWCFSYEKGVPNGIRLAVTIELRNDGEQDTTIWASVSLEASGDKSFHTEQPQRLAGHGGYVAAQFSVQIPNLGFQEGDVLNGTISLCPWGNQRLRIGKKVITKGFHAAYSASLYYERTL